MYKKIMVPLDGSQLAECIIPHLETFITGLKVEEVVFVRVEKYVSTSTGVDWQKKRAEKKGAAEAYLKQIIKRIKHNGTKLHTEVMIGNATDSLVDYASDNDFDLILIGTHGRSGISKLVKGSVAEHLLHSTVVPILIIRASGE